MDVTINSAPPLPWSEEQLGSELSTLIDAIIRIRRRNPTQPFYLGTTTVNVTAHNAALSPLSLSIDLVEIQNHQALTVNQAIEYLPGVTIDHKSPRNQTGISIGGFDSRQVPLYFDGIPSYVPFDGYVDLTRYLTSDVAAVQVAKGYSSPPIGPNALGGVVNVVTREPQKNLEGDVFIGTARGNQLDSGGHIGSRFRTFFLQASADRLQSDFYPISGSSQPNTIQRHDRRENSDQRDTRFRLRFAWTPRGQDQYVLSYSNEGGTTGIPPYSGNAPACPPGNATVAIPCVTTKFRRWPIWNTNSYYFNSNTGLGAAGTVQLRAFYVGYSNRMDMFDDATYSSMNVNASSGMSHSDDHSVGASGEFQTHAGARHLLGASFFVKNDTHVNAARAQELPVALSRG